ncbi:GNAT family N-acetyltransferase [Stappia sp.]|uniref:GNAT family N-acetyltransferase n=1 Tax=Stappia sp. TaxID=1870903 RepID=UPI003A9A5FFF
MSARIAIESPLGDEMRAMIGELNDVLLALSPPEHCHHLSVEQMAGADTTVFTAREGGADGALLACGALRRHGAGADGIPVGEVKRMYTRPAAQGRGLAGEILMRIEELARTEGIGRLVLETGHRHPAAWRVYERAGFARTGAVLDYPDTPFSVFYEKLLAAKA